MEEILELEARLLEEAVHKKQKVRLFLLNGYTTEAVIEDFDCNVIVATVNDRRWMVYRQGISTIELAR